MNNPEQELCPKCEQYNELKKLSQLPQAQQTLLAKLDIHQTIFKEQLNYFTNLRSKLNNKQLICIMDFSQFQISNNKHQDLIITLIDNTPPQENEHPAKTYKTIQPPHQLIPKYNQQPVFFHFFGGKRESRTPYRLWPMSSLIISFPNFGTSPIFISSQMVGLNILRYHQ